MDSTSFDALVRRFSVSTARRTILGTMGALGMAGAFSRTPWRAAEANRKKRRQKPKKNRFGCIDVGKKCYGKSNQCCSGICEGKKKKSRCVAHNVGACAAGDNSCPAFVECGVDGECFRTTGKASFCGLQATCDCHPCKKDKDCESEFGPGAACIVCTSDCIDVNGSKKGTACVPPAQLV